MSCAGHRRYPLAPSDSDSDEGPEPAPARQGAENALLVWRFQYTFTPFPEDVAAGSGRAEASAGGEGVEQSDPAGGAQLLTAAWGAQDGTAGGGDGAEAVAGPGVLAGAVQAAA